MFTFGPARQDDGSISPVPIAMAAGPMMMGAFVRDPAGPRPRRARRPGGPRGCWDVRSFRYGVIAALIVALGEFGLLFTLPLLLQNALGYSALGTGWLIVSLAVGMFLVSGATTPELTARWGWAHGRPGRPGQPRPWQSRAWRSPCRRTSAAGSSPPGCSLRLGVGWRPHS